MKSWLLAAAVSVSTLAFVAGCGSSPSAAPPAAPAGQFSAQTQQQLQQVVSTAQSQYQIPGVVAAVTVPGKGSWVQAAGLANTQANQPTSVNDKFKIGSITKTFTATVILQLVDQGKLSLSTPISQWVPNVPNAGTITVGQLLNMTSGIYNEGAPGSALAQQVAANPGQVFTPQQIVGLAVSQGPAGPVGTYSYSDTGYQILAIIAQAVTGQPIQNLITNQILKPLNLSNTSYPTSSAVPSPSTSGYFIARNQVVPAPQPDPSALGAAGAMISTVGDLQTWAKALATGSLLKPQTQQLRLQTVPTQVSFTPLPGLGQSTALPAQYGLGVINSGGFLGHNGVTNGYNSAMYYLPQQQATIVILANGQNVTAFGGKQEVADAMFANFADIINANAGQ
jgi:D-alanyl-D-alanine carboxypeptidase